MEPVDSQIKMIKLQDELVHREITRIELASTIEAERAENQAESDHRETTRIELASTIEARRAENRAESDRREITRMSLPLQSKPNVLRIRRNRISMR